MWDPLERTKSVWDQVRALNVVLKLYKTEKFIKNIIIAL